jgi:hypothetical protein
VIELHIGHGPRGRKPENLLVKFFVLHNGSPCCRILPNPRQTRMDQFKAPAIQSPCNSKRVAKQSTGW